MILTMTIVILMSFFRDCTQRACRLAGASVFSRPSSGATTCDYFVRSCYIIQYHSYTVYH